MKSNTNNDSLCRLTYSLLVGAFLVCLTVHSSAAPLVHLEFNNPNTATTTIVSSVGGYEFDLLNSAGNATALQTGTGVSGNVGDYSLNTTSATGMGTGTGPSAQYDATGPDITTGSLESFTLSFWFKTPVGVKLDGNARLFDSPNLEVLGFNGDANSRITVNFTTSAGLQTVSTSSSFTGLSLTDEWMFFAFTFDGTVGSGNARIFYGTLEDSVSNIITNGRPASSWNGLDDTQKIWLGKRDDNTDPFRGYIDDFRLYGSATGSSGALSLSELEIVRLQAVPEPSTITFLAIASIAFIILRRRAINSGGL